MSLPIDLVRERIVQTIRENQVVIVVGETGSGKTTRLPVFLYESDLSLEGRIGITEPRRIAATSVAKYVAEMLGTKLGDTVGYQVRFDDRAEEETKIKFMTDGILLREIQDDPDLSKYSVIMVDEAHERSVNIDFTLGLLKDLLRRRSDLKVVVASATIDAEKFSRYFSDAPVIEVSGRMYPVEIVWSGKDYSEREMVDAVVEKVFSIHTQEKEGDVLVFMTGTDDINRVISGLEEKGMKDVVFLPAHGGLALEDQRRIFEQFPGSRKVIVATNIAETSLTVDGVVYVVDSGLVKQTSFNADTGIQSLDPVKHSRAGSNQRAGRAGRTRSGICYRMYTETDFNDRRAYTEPEIRRMSLAGVVLAMELIGIQDIEKFEFVDQPESQAFHEAYETLIALGAIKSDRTGLTPLGTKMAKLPLEPRIARMVLEAERHGCVEEIITIAAFLSLRTVFVRPKGKEYVADASHRPFKVPSSDALTFLKVWEAYEANGFSGRWCFENYLHPQSLAEARNIRSQLFTILTRGGVEIEGSKGDDAVLRSVASGLVQNLLQHAHRFQYDGLIRQNLSAVHIHPGSSVFGHHNPRWIVCSGVVETSKAYARGVSQVKPEWLPELAPKLFCLGRPQLTKLLPEEGKVLGYRPVLQQGQGVNFEQEVGQVEIKVSIEEAQKIQEERIEEARLLGFILLSIHKNSASDSLWRNMNGSDEEGVNYRISLFSKLRPEAGGTYYCKVVPSYFGGTSSAEPQFRVFNLPKPKEESEKTEVSDLGPIDALQKAWGARVKK